MSSLPDWLWPSEDEEAVLEAERLIEETHEALQKMESEIFSDNLRNKFSFKTEKLKNSVINKMHVLEKELKDVTKLPEGCQHSSSSQCSLHKTRTFKSSPKIQHKCSNTKDQEKVVSTARDKIQDALQVARSVSASLKQHTSSSAATPKPASSLKAANVGIFEIKSHKDETGPLPVKPRLAQSQISSVSIKRNLECQVIPSVYLPPTEKPTPQNVAICHAQHKEVNQDKKCEHYPSSLDNLKEKDHVKKSPVCDVNAMDVTQLSRQLEQVEELRELNQVQVNHVLRFLISRVSALSNPSPVPSHSANINNHENIQKKVVNINEPKTSPSSQSTSSSDSRPKIAYDSLSRFLETYRQAAHQAMIAEKKAALRQKEQASKHERFIEVAKRSNANHLAVDHLRQNQMQNRNISTEIKMQPEKPLSDSEIFLSNTSSEGMEKHDVPSSKSISHEDKSNITNGFVKDNREIVVLRTPSSSTADSSEAHPSKTSADDYEDDWEEEVVEDPDKAIQSNEGNPALKTILEVKEHSFPRTEEHSINTGLVFERSTSPSNAPEVAQTTEEPSPISPLHLSASNLAETSVEPFARTPQSKDSGPSPKHTLKAVDTLSKTTGSYFLAPQAVPDYSVPFDEIISNAEENRPSKPTKDHIDRRKSRARKFSSCSSSSSDADAAHYHKTIPKRKRGLELKLKDDLQLRSAILLSWQLEDHMRGRLSQVLPQLDRREPSTSQPHSTLLTDVEERWKKAMDELDERIRAMEEHENVTRMLRNLNLRTREEQTQTSPVGKLQNNWKELKVDEGRSTWEPNAKGSLKISQDKMEDPHTEGCSKVSSPEPVTKPQLTDNMGLHFQKQMVKTAGSDFQMTSEPERQAFKESALTSQWYQNNQKTLRLPYELWHSSKRDLTEDLLVYTRMGVLSKNVETGHLHSSSLSSSMSSYLQPNSNFRVSLSDGEMQANGSGNCSCSEGEVCFCRSEKGGKRAPPDGSNAQIDNDCSLKDVSQGEIAFSEGDPLLKDSSQGEVAFSNFAGEISLTPEMSIGSDDTE